MNNGEYGSGGGYSYCPFCSKIETIKQKITRLEWLISDAEDVYYNLLSDSSNKEAALENCYSAISEVDVSAQIPTVPLTPFEDHYQKGKEILMQALNSAKDERTSLQQQDDTWHAAQRTAVGY